MSDLLNLSESIAREAHAGQLYDTRDYVDAHVAPVAQMIAKMGYSEDYQATGWLHDVPEDSEISTAELLTRGVPRFVVESVDLLRKKGEPHSVYLDKIAEDPRATVGKFADSSINLANTILRASEIETPKYLKWIRTYTGNLAFLLPHLPPSN